MGKSSFFKACDQCGAKIKLVQLEGGRWMAYNPDTTTEHWLTCTSEDAKQRRVRRGREAFTFPISPSFLKDYASCPRYCAAKHFHTLKALGKIPQWLEDDIYSHFPDGKVAMPEIEAGLFGRAAHVYFAARLKGKAREEARELASAEGIPFAFWRNFQITAAIFDRQFESGRWPTADASIEDRQTYSWQEGEVTVELKVILDYWRIVDGRIDSTDWKTGRMSNDNEYELLEDVQAGANMLVLQRLLPHLKGGVFRQVQFRSDADRPVEATFSTRDLDGVELALRSQVRRILADERFDPNPYCDVCPPGLHPMPKFAITVLDDGEVEMRLPLTASREEADRIAQVAAAADRISKAAKDALRAWCDVNGEVGGFAHYLSTSRQLKPEWSEEVETPEGVVVRKMTGIEKAFEIIRERGFAGEIGRKGKLDGTWLRSVFSAKKYASLARDLAPLFVDVQESKFERRHKPAGERVALKDGAEIVQLPVSTQVRDAGPEPASSSPPPAAADPPEPVVPDAAESAPLLTLELPL